MPTRQDSQEFSLNKPYDYATKPDGLDSVSIKVSNSIFRNQQIGDKIEVEIVAMSITQEIRA